MERPGFVVYFDLLDQIQELSDAERGQLLTGMLEYGKYGVLPEFKGMLAMAWRFLRPKMDRDAEAYAKTIEGKRYATYCRECKKNGIQELSREDWRVSIDYQNHHVISHDIARYQTKAKTKTEAKTESQSISKTETITESESITESKTQTVELDLSEEQRERLVGFLGRDVFERCAAKLEDNLRAGQSADSHYLAILRLSGELWDGGAK